MEILQNNNNTQNAILPNLTNSKVNGYADEIIDGFMTQQTISQTNYPNLKNVIQQIYKSRGNINQTQRETLSSMGICGHSLISLAWMIGEIRLKYMSNELFPARYQISNYTGKVIA